MRVVKTEIFVLNYNGRDLLIECLPTIIEAAKRSPVACKVTVIDNQSRDDSMMVLQKYFPGVRSYVTPKNTVLCAFNDAVKNSDADVVLLLNNDLKADPEFIGPLLKPFQERDDIFMTAPMTFTFDGSQYEGSLSKIHWRFGLPGSLSRFPGYEAKINTPSVTMQSGFGAFRRDAFLELGGYDDLYLPGTVEDLDLCYRSWKAGYRSLYVPESRMNHKGQATFKKNFSRFRILTINQRNLYLFVWKNITSGRLLFDHLLWLLLRPLWFLLQGRAEFLFGLLSAFGRLPAALKRRKLLHPEKDIRGDREVLQISGGI